MDMVEHVPILEAKNLEVERGGALLLEIPSFSIGKG
jgi:hypothetical protein